MNINEELNLKSTGHNNFHRRSVNCAAYDHQRIIPQRRNAGARCKIMQPDANFDPSVAATARRALLGWLLHLPSVRAACQKAAFWRKQPDENETLSLSHLCAPAQIMENRGGARATSDARRMGCARLLIFHRRPNKITIKKGCPPGAGQSFLRVARE